MRIIRGAIYKNSWSGDYCRLLRETTPKFSKQTGVMYPVDGDRRRVSDTYLNFYSFVLEPNEPWNQKTL